VKAIDVHVHPYTQEVLDVTPEWFWGHARKTFGGMESAISVEQMLAEMDAAEVEKAVVLAFDVETAHGWKVSNELVADIVERAPDRLVGFASVDPNKGELAVRELERAVRELGLKGLKLHPPTQHFVMNERRHYPLWGKCQELGVPMLVHTGHNQSGGRLKYADPTFVDDVALDFPELRIILAHFGFPWVEQAISVAWIRRNCYLELSGWSPKYIPETVWRYANSLLQDRVLFGTDWPVMSMKRWLDDFEATPLKPDVKEKILYRTAARLLFGEE
jgi:predicted TIM-barrel fold metal-dependent hydrolase